MADAMVALGMLWRATHKCPVGHPAHTTVRDFFVICRRGGHVRLSKFTFPAGYIAAIRERMQVGDSRL